MNRNLVYFILPCAALLASSAANENDASKALEQIKSLVGNWDGTAKWTGARTGSYPLNASYYVTGNGSALVENLIQEGVPVMTSVYHLDGADLRMTHFCAAQNQPRLKANHIDLGQGLIDFDFVDITNLRSADAPHVHGLKMRLLDHDHLSITFLFAAGEKESQEQIDLKRVPTKPS